MRMNEMKGQENKNLPAMETYKPSELLAMFTAYLSRQEAYSHVVYLQEPGRINEKA